MSRGKKDRVVKQIKHRSGATVDLLFNPNENALNFYAVVADERIVDNDAEVVIAKVIKLMDSSMAMKWIPIIEVNEVRPFVSSSGSFVGLDIERFYAAKKLDGNGYRVRWGDYDERDTNAVKMNHARQIYRFNPEELPRFSNSHHGWETWMKYDEATWQALCAIVDNIELLKSKLEDLVTHESGLAKIAQLGQAMTKMLREGKP